MAELEVGVRQLKNHLSRYLREVKRGRTVVITERGKPIGRIIPKGLPVADRIEALAKAGLVEWNGKRINPTEPVVVNRSSRLVSDILVEMRE